MTIKLLFRAGALTAAFIVSAISFAQVQQPATQLSPRAAYDEAMHPLEATRRSIANWSDAEVQALAVAVQQAATACAARATKDFTGALLIDYARLCALGQAWPTVIEASSAYIATEAPAKPLLIQAYAARLDAYLHLKNEPPALADGKAMLATLPYDGLSSEVIDEAIEYMQFTSTADALTLATAREPLLLDRIRATKTLVPPPSHLAPESSPAAAPLAAAPAFVEAPVPSAHELYAQGLALAAMQQLIKQPAAAAETVAALDAALPATLTPDETLPIASARRRYALLGQPLPQFAPIASLSVPAQMPALPAFHAITALLLFPDWCAQCVRMGKQFPPSVFEVSGHEAYMFGLLGETSPPPSPSAAPDPAAKPLPRQVLRDTPTLIVSPKVLDQFVATDYPFLVIADSHGIVRVLQPVDDNALQFGGIIDSAIGRVGDLWPTTPPKPADTPKPATAPVPATAQ